MHAFGTYFDGRVAIGHPALIEGDGMVLVIRDRRGREMTRWLPAEVRLADAGVKRTDLRLKRLPPHQDRFVVADAHDARWLLERCPRLRSGDGRGGGRSWHRLAAWVGLAAAALVGFFELLLPLVADRAARAIPRSLETHLGEVARLQTIAELASRKNGGAREPVCTRATGQHALDRLVAALGARAEPPLSARVTVLNNEIVNAFALPDAQILVTRGLLDFARHPDEVAGVIAHELGHVAQRHPTAVAIEQAGDAIVLGALIGDVTGGSLLGGAVVHLVATRYSREAEREADGFGALLMDRAGYDRQRLLMLLDRMEREHPDPASLLPFLSTHPLPAERRAALSTPAPTASDAPALGPEEWQALQRICD